MGYPTVNVQLVIAIFKKNMYQSLQDKITDISCSDKWDENEGTIQLVISNNEDAEASKIVDLIEADIEAGISPNDICIICKQKVGDYTGKIIESLKEKDIRARIETEYQDLLKDELISIYLDFLLLANNRKNPTSFENIISFYALLFPELDSAYEQHSLSVKRLDEFLNDLYESLIKVQSSEELLEVIELICEYCGKERIKSVFSQYQQGNFFDEQTRNFADLLWNEYEQAGVNSWNDAVAGFAGKNSIPIMTIHKSKGLEYTCVYFLGLEDSAFWNFKNQPEEDRCAFFVALSRAKRKIVFTFAEYRNNLKYPKQNRKVINEFYELLRNSGCAEVIRS